MDLLTTDSRGRWLVHTQVLGAPAPLPNDLFLQRRSTSGFHNALSAEVHICKTTLDKSWL